MFFNRLTRETQQSIQSVTKFSYKLNTHKDLCYEIKKIDK